MNHLLCIAIELLVSRAVIYPSIIPAAAVDTAIDNAGTQSICVHNVLTTSNIYECFINNL